MAKDTRDIVNQMAEKKEVTELQRGKIEITKRRDEELKRKKEDEKK